VSKRLPAESAVELDVVITADSIPRRANVIGLGLIGGSVALALGQRGWRVQGDDVRSEICALALSRGVIAAIGLDPDAEITIIASPVLALPELAKRALAETSGVVTDVGSTKASIAAAIDDPRFVGGHPMAGSELDGLDGADGDMFEAAVWVLTPTASTADSTFAAVAELVNDLGAEVVALSPQAHDDVVAVISHVPHLAAATLMGLAAERSDEHSALLRLAAGGFRDMTRIASGNPTMWLDICADNRTAILRALDGLIDGLGSMRTIVANDDRESLYGRLSDARQARTNLPARINQPSEFAEVRIAIPDRPGAAAEVFTLAAELGVNISDFEVVHSAEGNRGVAVVLIDAAMTELFRGGLLARGFRPAIQRLT
jgi:prephenate dehydrogenase